MQGLLDPAIEKTRTLDHKDIYLFQKTIDEHYHSNGRRFPWRQTTDPYHILVSEIMLQQTQTERVINYYGPFIERFPDFRTLADAELKDVLLQWQGLGYNRRAIHLKKTAEVVMTRFKGKMPVSYDEILKLPGIGMATAGAILAFALNKPVTFIETNIRRVFIHVFFQDRKDIRDGEILPLVKKTLKKDNPRQWYYALMDYGAMLKKSVPNPNRKSAHYTRPEPFEGSDRQIRGEIIRQLARRDMDTKVLIELIDADPDRTKKNLLRLKEEGFLILSDSKVKIR